MRDRVGSGYFMVFVDDKKHTDQLTCHQHLVLPLAFNLGTTQVMVQHILKTRKALGECRAPPCERTAICAFVL